MQNSRTNVNYLEQVMKLGLDRAARAFSKFMGTPAKNGMTPGAYSVDHLAEFVPTKSSEQFFVLITQVIGDFTGKSYLIFSEAESRLLMEQIRPSTLDANYREAVMLEADNIISASFIAELAESLGAEVYGDIPMLKKMSTEELSDFIHSDWEIADPAKLVFAQTRFDVEAIPGLKPFFIWKISARILEKVPKSKLAS